MVGGERCDVDAWRVVECGGVGLGVMRWRRSCPGSERLRSNQL